MMAVLMLCGKSAAKTNHEGSLTQSEEVLLAWPLENLASLESSCSTACIAAGPTAEPPLGSSARNFACHIKETR